jgi:hypothetical protein
MSSGDHGKHSSPSTGDVQLRLSTAQVVGLTAEKLMDACIAVEERPFEGRVKVTHLGLQPLALCRGAVPKPTALVPQYPKINTTFAAGERF